MPSFAVRRNCSATISSAPQQDAALNTASSGRDDRPGFVILLQPHLGNSSSRAREFTSNRSGLARAFVPDTVPLVLAHGRKLTLQDRTSKGWHGASARRPSPRTGRRSLRALLHLRCGGSRLHHRSSRLVQRCSRSFSSSRSWRPFLGAYILAKCCLGESACRL
jgi:hypothetical protein